MGGRHRNENVIALLRLERAEHGFDGGGAGFDVDHLVADRVAVQRRLLAGNHVGDADVRVAEDQPASGDHIGVGPDRLREQVVQLQVTRLERMIGSRALVGQLPHGGIDDRRRDVAVVEQ